ncbi:MAG: hypothetical protein ACI865_000440 [Flavobacteriaceae bacterium]|jgi:hypothetical protein
MNLTKNEQKLSKRLNVSYKMVTIPPLIRVFSTLTLGLLAILRPKLKLNYDEIHLLLYAIYDSFCWMQQRKR